jgi:hypothetical protein
MNWFDIWVVHITRSTIAFPGLNVHPLNLLQRRRFAGAKMSLKALTDSASAGSGEVHAIIFLNANSGKLFLTTVFEVDVGWTEACNGNILI